MNNKLKIFYLSEFHTENEIYRSPVIDSGDRGMRWHRLRIFFDADIGAKTYVACYASDNIHEAFSPNAFIFAYENPSDVLLHDAVGRYFWFSIEFSGICKTTVHNAYVSYPAVSPLEYLPEVYRNNDFADKFLSIFSALYDDVEQQIEHSSALYDANAAPDSFIFQMAEWLALPNLFLWNASELRNVLLCAVELYRIKGTAEGIKRVISIYTGGKANIFIVETYHAMRYYSLPGGTGLKKLYSDDRFSFWVLIYGDIDEKIKKGAEYLLMQNKPAHTKAHLITLKACLITDVYVYLGINSVLSEYNEASLNGECPSDYIILGG